MKNQILFIHSAGPQGMDKGSSNLVAYLKNKLGAAYEILYPVMPHPEDPKYEQWKSKLEKIFSVTEDRLILVGHSLGASVLLKYLSENKLNKSVAGLFLIATPYWGKEDWKLTEFMLDEDFVSKLPRIPKICFYHSREDEVVPVDHLHAYEQKFTQAKITVIEGNAHHFNKGLPEIVDAIENL